MILLLLIISEIGICHGPAAASLLQGKLILISLEQEGTQHRHPETSMAITVQMEPFFKEQGFLPPPGHRGVLLAPRCQFGGVRKRQHEAKGMQFPLFCSFPFPPASSSIRCFCPPVTPWAAAPAPAPSTKALQHSW